MLDDVVTIAYMNTRQRETKTIPGYATKMVEEKKLYADGTSERPFARIHGDGILLCHLRRRMVNGWGHMRSPKCMILPSAPYVKAARAALHLGT